MRIQFCDAKKYQSVMCDVWCQDRSMCDVWRQDISASHMSPAQILIIRGWCHHRKQQCYQSRRKPINLCWCFPQSNWRIKDLLSTSIPDTFLRPHMAPPHHPHLTRADCQCHFVCLQPQQSRIGISSDVSLQIAWPCWTVSSGRSHLRQVFVYHWHGLNPLLRSCW